MSRILRLNSDQELKSRASSQQVTLILKKAKAKLMSHEIEQQREAVSWLRDELNSISKVGRDLFVDILLKSEIIVLLCETTMTMQGSLVRESLDCLASLKKSEQFYKQNHASYVVASILRTGHFLALQEPGKTKEDKSSMLASIVRTLELIFEGATNFKVSTNEICDFQQVFSFFKKLLSRESNTYRIIFSTAKIIGIVLRFTPTEKALKKVKSEALVLKVVSTTLNLMRQVIEAKNQSEGKYAFCAMAMTCMICASGIPLCGVASDRETKEPVVSPSSKFRENLAGCIISSIMKAVIPNFNKLDFEESYGQFYAWFISSLNGIYDLKSCSTKDLSNYLAEQGYLRILPILSTFITQNLRNEILLLLSRMLTTLATDSLFAKTWLGGTKQFQRFLFNNFSTLPLDPSTWLSCLSEGDDRADALLVFFYYYFLAETTDASLYLPLIVGYVISSASLKKKKRSFTILKALWFIFSISAVSHENPSAIRSYDAATTRLFNELESVDVEQCYTHHPAVLIHCLRSIVISDKLRLGVVCFWLERDGDIGHLFDGIVDRDVTNHCLVEIIRTGSPRSVDAVEKVMDEMLSDNVKGVEGFGNIVWEILPQMLASSDSENAHNIKSVLNLASMYEPRGISGIALVRSLYQLMRFVVDNEADLNLASLGLRNVYCLLQLSISRKDARGVTMFTKEPRLIKILKNLAFGKGDEALSHTCFHCLSLLVKHQAQLSIESEESLVIELEDLLQQLYADDYIGALRLAAAIFTTKIERPIIKLSGISSGFDCNEVISDLYFQIHNTYAKNGPEDRNCSYILLVGLLNHCELLNNTKLLKVLCEEPWTYCIIRMAIDGSHGVLDSNFMQFLSTWLYYRCLISKTSKLAKNGRALCRDQFETTLDLIGNAVISTFKKKPKKEGLPELVRIMLFFEDTFTDNISAQLIELDQQLDKGSRVSWPPRTALEHDPVA